MKKIFLYSSIMLGLCSIIDTAQSTYETSDLISSQNAILRILDKPSGKTKVFNLELNKPYKIDRLTINARSCFKTPEYMPNENMAFIQIDKSGGNIDSKTSNIFSGWMYASMPGQNPLKDETYDIWLLKCE